MKRLCDCIRAIFLSWECVVILIACAAYVWFPDFIKTIGVRLSTGNEGIKWLALIPVALFFPVLKDRQQLLFPDEHGADIYQEWPDYRMVSDRYFITVGWVLSCAIVSVAVWVLHAQLSDPLNFCLFFGAISVSLCAYAHLFIAAFTLKRMLGESHRKSHPKSVWP
jgi:hypothetical protein